MPNRILRPWVDSEAVNSLSDAAEVFFVRLIQCADDYGRFYGTPMLLKSYLFPLKDKRVADISRWIAECVKAGLIADYEVSGKRFIEIRKFNQRLRMKCDSKFPAPPVGSPPDDSHMTVICQSCDSQMTARDGDGDERRIMKSSGDKSPPDFSPKRSGAKAHRITFGYDDDNLIHGITEQDLEEWRKFYPALDIEQELRSASSWLKGNPRNRKTDILRFLTNWFQRAQQRAPRVNEASLKPRWSDHEEGENADDIF